MLPPLAETEAQVIERTWIFSLASILLINPIYPSALVVVFFLNEEAALLGGHL